MSRYARCLLLALAGSGAVTHEGAAAQTASPEVTLKTTVGKPGSEVRVPIYLDPAGTNIGSLVLRLSFPAPSLSFVKLELASRRLEPVAKATKAGVVEGQPDVLEVEIANDKEPLPAGPLGWLIFRIAGGAKPGEMQLRLTRTSAQSVSGDKIARVNAGDARVMVIDPAAADALLSCFFYMH